MGQYYCLILGDTYSLNCKIFDRSVNHEYTHKIPGRVCWVGDYATEPNDFNFNLPAGIVRPNYKKRLFVMQKIANKFVEVMCGEEAVKNPIDSRI